MKIFAQKMKSLLETRKQIIESKKRKQDGFTLLELLVVVAILAAIAGTATIALKDTDMRASAAAHVTMMDELNKGVSTYRVLQRNQYPNRFDSLMQVSDLSDPEAVVNATSGAEPLAILGFEAGDGYATFDIPLDVQGIMAEAGITQLRYVSRNAAFDPEGEGNCAETDLHDLIKNRGNDVVPGNIFMSPDANGCGISVSVSGNTGHTKQGMFWSGGTERLTGQPDPAGVGTEWYVEDNYAYLLTGIGPSSTLFDANTLGGMTTVPVYRHVKPDQYNRFIAVWKVGTYGSGSSETTPVINVADQLDLVAIVDGALDTKEEELGEWDGSRNTI